MWTGIELLHILQDIRLDFPFLEGFFLTISSRIFYMILPILLIMAIMWLYDKEKGEIIGLGCVSAMITSSIIKLIAAQPRPWVLDPEIQEVSGAHADGYSLPSGHTTIAASTYLPMAWLFRKRVLISAAMVIIAVLIMTARLMLCVHTPLDIISALLIAVVMSLIAFKATEIGKRGERAYYCISLAYLALFSVMAVFACTYSNAELKEILQSSGFFYGFMIGRLVEHRYVGYVVKERNTAQKIRVYLIGILVAAVLLAIPMVAIPVAGTFVGGILMMIWCIGLYPMVMQKKDW